VTGDGPVTMGNEAELPAPSATIHLRRAPTRWADRARAYIICVDGNEQGRIRHREDIQFAVPAGNHRVQLRIDWCRSDSLDLSVEPGDEVFLECRSRPAWQMLYWVTLGRERYIVLDRVKVPSPKAD
jgi:hypothetical protein